MKINLARKGLEQLLQSEGTERGLRRLAEAGAAGARRRVRRRSGRLARSIVASSEPGRAAWSYGEFYGTKLQLGTRHMRAYPFMVLDDARGGAQ